jgi:undecaprenyl phosphate-alpha-L-ara4N flippase subunit ArnE
MQLEFRKFVPWMALGGSIVLSSFAQVSLKHGLNMRKNNTSSSVTIFAPWLFAWFIAFGVATYLWIIALRNLDLSYAYPLLALGYVVVTALAATFLNENVSRTQWIAVVIIAAGAAFVAGSV